MKEKFQKSLEIIKIWQSYQNLRDGNINPRKVSKNQINIKSDLGKIKKGNSSFKSKEQISVIQKHWQFFALREKIIDFLEIILFWYLKVKHKKGLKLLTPKQMHQRLPIALAKVKVGNTSEYLLNEICQILYSLYHAKKS